jgi:hypothetical protein
MRIALNLLVSRLAARPNAISKPLTRLVTTKAMIFSLLGDPIGNLFKNSRG